MERYRHYSSHKTPSETIKINETPHFNQIILFILAVVSQFAQRTNEPLFNQIEFILLIATSLDCGRDKGIKTLS